MNIFKSKVLQFDNSEQNSRKNIVLISAYNEELNIKETIEAILNSIDFKLNRIYIGLDNCDDQTKSIIQSFDSDLVYISEYNRIGKPNVINKLILDNNLNQNDFNLFFIDANISVEHDCLNQLNLVLNHNKVGIVGASILTKSKELNIESKYIERENLIKYNESRVHHSVVGVFGGCYAMKGELYNATPENTITDDLYHSFNILKNRLKVLYSLEAKAYENITADIMNEFNRKKRYSAGNFQIFFKFFTLLFPWNSSLGFIYSYFFHKIFRWFSPLLLLVFWMFSLSQIDFASQVVRFIGLGFIFIIILNTILLKKNLVLVFNRLYYFLMMNLAILCGFFNYLVGIKSNVWSRSKR